MKIQIDINNKELYKYVQIKKIQLEKNTLAETVVEILRLFQKNDKERIK